MLKEAPTLHEYALSITSNEVESDLQEVSIQTSPEVTIHPRFPSLEYDIASKTQSIAGSAAIILLLNGLVPAVLYYILQYRTSFSRSTVITVVEIPTTFSVIHWPYRIWLLRSHNGERAPKSQGSFTLDMFQWNFLLGIALVSAFCIVAGIKESMRWYLFGFVALIGLAAAVLLFSLALAWQNVRIPVRLSSVSPGSVMRPVIYYLIEDLTACEGAGGRGYRERLNIRWESSSLFRKLLNEITLVSGISLLIQTGVQFPILFATPEKVFVGLSTAVLWGWFGATLLWGWRYSKSRLRNEREKWETNSGLALGVLGAV